MSSIINYKKYDSASQMPKIIKDEIIKELERERRVKMLKYPLLLGIFIGISLSTEIGMSGILVGLLFIILSFSYMANMTIPGINPTTGERDEEKVNAAIDELLKIKKAEL